MSRGSDLIGIAAGDGLASMHELLETVILPALRAPSDGEDGYWMPTGASRHLVLTTDGYTVDPIEFPGGDIGRLAFCGAGNDLLASGATLRQLTISLFLSPHLRRDQLQRALCSLGDLAAAHGVEVVCGDTKVLPELGSGMLMAVTAIGEPLSTRKYDLRETLEGDQIVITGRIGAHSIAVLSAREGLGFDQVVQSDANYLIEPIVGALNHFGDAIHGLRDLTRGGLLAGLWEGAKSTGLCWQFTRSSLPVKTEVAAACEVLDLEPIALTNEGVMMITVAPPFADALVSYLRTFEQTSWTTKIGGVCSSAPCNSPRVLQLDPAADMPYPDGVGKPRLC
jgi:hydrogenase expression/formation protein HypE